jgi:hypothetical protein
LHAALKLGVQIGLDEMPSDEFYALLVLEQERDKLDREKLSR